MRFLDRFRRRGGETSPEFDGEEFEFDDEGPAEELLETSREQVEAEEISEEEFRVSDEMELDIGEEEVSEEELPSEGPPPKEGLSVKRIVSFAVIALALLCVGYVARPVIDGRLLGREGKAAGSLNAEIEATSGRIKSLKRTLASYQELGTPEDLELFLTQGKAFLGNSKPVHRLTEELDLWLEKGKEYDDLLVRHDDVLTSYGQDKQSLARVAGEITKAGTRLKRTGQELAEESVRYEALVRDLEPLQNERFALEAAERESFLQETRSFEEFLENIADGGH